MSHYKHKALIYLRDLLEKHTHSTVISYHGRERATIIDTIKRLKRERGFLMHNNEAYQLYMAAAATAKVDGDMAEVGTYQGASAKLLSGAMHGRTLHVFDTFEGLPDVTEADGNTRFEKAQMASSFDDVSAYLSAIPNLHIYKGLFPASGVPIQNKKFSFVHLDVDLYQGTKESLEFFYPRMNKGGIFIIHDYTSKEGVRNAVDPFFKDKPEPVIEMSGTQALIVKA